MEMSNQPFAACTESEAIGEGAGAGTLGSTPARWLVAFTAEAMRVGVSYKYGWRSFSGASWEIVNMEWLGVSALLCRLCAVGVGLSPAWVHLPSSPRLFNSRISHQHLCHSRPRLCQRRRKRCWQ